MKQQGIVVVYFAQRGFGFIERDGQSVFFHAKNVLGSVILRAGDKVEFEIHLSPRNGKTECFGVVLIERASASEIRQ